MSRNGVMIVLVKTGPNSRNLTSIIQRPSRAHRPTEEPSSHGRAAQRTITYPAYAQQHARPHRLNREASSCARPAHFPHDRTVRPGVQRPASCPADPDDRTYNHPATIVPTVPKPNHNPIAGQTRRTVWSTQAHF
ncbi:unnamed protein product [Microthlaspi erraticum]|uniref:Uncharacterized protein n=1 Tax=Microthlaspi erraticum TaxID=1685480 RepID=A0A6D2IBU5_9BRAS|nr:unnamed protein product [Microthlaspi erraticum]